MLIHKLTIEGLRGFSKKTEINFSIPDKINRGSGLTVIVGPNNSGKSTVIEAIHILNSNSSSIPKNSRNIINNGNVKIVADLGNNNNISIETIKQGGSLVYRKYNGKIIENQQNNNKLNAFILSSKRNFTTTFNGYSEQTRINYKGNVGNEEFRRDNNINQFFGSRLLRIINGQKEQFDNCLIRVLNPIPKWTIENNDGNQNYLEFSFGQTNHSSQGAGDGYINIFNIIDALYDSEEDNIILIDEPEISLHPDLQKKLYNLLLDYSKDKQIIICTHSPYFINWESFSKYSKIIRLRKENEEIKNYELSDISKNNIQKLLKDTGNLHLFSLNTNEVFFLNDNVILTEGQEDVVGYKKIFNIKNYYPDASFFGWGLGGASNADIVLKMLKDLGYKKVFVILDNDRKNDIEQLEKKFPKYHYYAISADDIRDKNQSKSIKDIINKIEKANIEKEEKEKIIDYVNKKFPIKKGIFEKLNSNMIRSEYDDNINDLINQIKKYFDSNTSNNNPKQSESKNEIEKNSDTNYNKARELLNNFNKENNVFKSIETKYDYIDFNFGSGDLLSMKMINDNEYYAIIEETKGISSKYKTTFFYHYIINIKDNTVKLQKEEIIENTLPNK